MNEFNFLSELYDDIYCWLATNTPGERSTKGYFKNKDKKIWNRIRNKLIELEKRNNITKVEKEFLKCKYVGKAYRKIHYFKKRHGQVCLLNCYQSCSKTIKGLKNVSIHGDVVFVELFANEYSYAIDVYNLLMFMIKYNLIVYKDEFEKKYHNVLNLEGYINEEEVVVVLSADNVRNISVRNFETGLILALDKTKWYRNNLN